MRQAPQHSGPAQQSLVQRIWRLDAVRFVVVGALNTLFGYGVYAACIALGFNRPVALACNSILGTIFNFFTTGRIVFGSSDVRRILRFVIAYAIIFGLNVALLEAIVRLLSVNSYIGQLIAIPPIVILTYFVMRLWVFDRR